MTIISFPDHEKEERALGKLPGRFSFKTWETSEMMVPEAALSFLAIEGVEFTVKGRAMGRLRRYEILLPLQFNVGSDVPEALITATLREFRQRFGAVSCYQDPVHGQWEHEGA